MPKMFYTFDIEVISLTFFDPEIDMIFRTWKNGLLKREQK